MIWKPSTWDLWDVGIDKGIGKRAETESLEATPAKGKGAHKRWNATEEGTWYLRQSVVLEVIYKGSNYRSPL